MAQRLVPASPDVVFEEFEEELVVLNLANGQYFGLNPSASMVWRALMDGADPATITVSGDSAPIAAFVQRLSALELVAPGDDAAKNAALNVDAGPTIEAYDDLADLIMADPFHDVESEVGWPKLAK